MRRNTPEILSGVPGICLQRILPGNVSSYKDTAFTSTGNGTDLTATVWPGAAVGEHRDEKVLLPALHRQKLYSGFHEQGSNGCGQLTSSRTGS